MEISFLVDTFLERKVWLSRLPGNESHQEVPRGTVL